MTTTADNINPADLLSDDSSFYGDEEETKRLEDLASQYDPTPYWTNIHPRLLSTIQHKEKKKSRTAAEMETMDIDIDTHTPGPLPRNKPGKNEPVSDFLARLPPSTTKAETIGSWIYVSNPHSPERDQDIASFVSQGTERLHQFENEKARITLQHDRSGSSSTAALNRKLNPLRKELEQWIFSLARETGVVTGKWMMFITADRIDAYWRVVADATMRGELGCAAKVATDDGLGRARLICVYTNDYEDREDIRRVLGRLMELGLVKRGERPIYYKCDAFTYLEIKGNNPYGLRASLFSSADVLAGKV